MGRYPSGGRPLHHIVGLKRLKDFYPGLVAESIASDRPRRQDDAARPGVDCVVRGGVATPWAVHARSLRREEGPRAWPQVAQDGEIVGPCSASTIERVAAWPTSSPIFEI